MRFLHLEGLQPQLFGESFHYAKKHFEMIDQPTVEVYPPGNRQAEDYEMEVWIPIKEEV